MRSTALPQLADAAPDPGVRRPGAPSAADVDVVVVSYRNRELVLQTLQSLAALEAGPAVTVTVVDNDSRDGTVEAIHAAHPDVLVVQQYRNTGFAHANNVGMALGTGRYVLVLNPDTHVAPDALRRLVDFADSHRDAGVVAPALRNPDGTDQRTARAFPTAAAGLFGRRSVLTRLFPGNPWSARFLRGRERVGSEPFRVDWVSGAAMLVPRAVIEHVGGFDENFFLFWEDADWCRRMADAGYSVWCVPSAQVIHDEGGSRAHGWNRNTIRWFHQGAYRYWTKHHAPSPWNPLRWSAAAALTGRAALLTVRHTIARRPAGTR